MVVVWLSGRTKRQGNRIATSASLLRPKASIPSANWGAHLESLGSLAEQRLHRPECSRGRTSNDECQRLLLQTADQLGVDFEL